LPQVSVVIPVYNGEAYLAEALDSVLAQTISDWELIIVNDGSSDGTAAILESYAHRDPRIRVITQTNRGLAASRGRAVAAARGELVAFLDADDIWLPAKLERQTAAARQHPQCGIITCDALQFEGERVRTPSLKEWYQPGSGDVLEHLLFGNWIPPSAAMVRRAHLAALTTYDVPPPGYGEDWLMWMQITSVSPVYFLDEVLVRRRIHAGAMSSQAADTQFACLMRNFEIVRERIPRLSGPPNLVDRAIYHVSRRRALGDLRALRLAPARAKLRQALSVRPWSLDLRLLLLAARLPPPCWRAAKRALGRRG